jgi:hypothetical protein
MDEPIKQEIYEVIPKELEKLFKEEQQAYYALGLTESYVCVVFNTDSAVYIPLPKNHSKKLYDFISQIIKKGDFIYAQKGQLHYCLPGDVVASWLAHARSKIKHPARLVVRSIDKQNVLLGN